MDSESRRVPVCVVSTADWNAPLWTNKQYMARELAVDHDVVFVGSVGLRRPRLNRRDVLRIVDRLRSGSGSSQPVPDGMQVSSPKMVPIHNRASARFNDVALDRAARTWLSRTEPKVLWTYSPIVYGLAEAADAVVYHAVDLLGSYPGIDAEMIRRAEIDLARHCDVAIGSSEVVAEHLDAAGFQHVELWPNVADIEPYITERDCVRNARRVAFGGNITPYKIDLALMVELAEEVGDLEIVMCGPTDEGGAGEWKEISRLRELGVEFTGTLTLDGLADQYARSAVGIIPYELNEYTRGVNPLKLYEYLAAGLGVVSTPVPSVATAAESVHSGDLFVAGSAADFCDAVDRLARPVDQETIKRRRALAEENSWKQRGRQARSLIETIVPTRHS